MPESIPQILLWLFVVFAGIAVGAGLYEMRITVPQWFPPADGGRLRVDHEAMRRADSGRRFWVYVTTGPLTLLTLANLVVAWRAEGPIRDWWLAAAAITLLERLGTLGYFIPQALRLMTPNRLPEEKAAALAAQWVRMNRVRAALALLGWLAGLKALQLT